MKRLVTIVLSTTVLVGVLAVPAAAVSPVGEATVDTGDNIESVLSRRQTELRRVAQQMVLRGEAKPVGANQVVKVRHGKGGEYVQLAFQGKDQILTLLGQFGTSQATHDHGTLGVINHEGGPGPAHNEIPQPNRSVDNSTIWEPDFSREYYDTLLYDRGTFPSMANYYLEQSSGAYTVDGYVSDWVTVPYNAAAYGSNYCGSNVCTRDVGRFVEDQADTWWTALVAQKGSVAAANKFLKKFDKWDRYDFDGDGNFNEPDGYIDHFQSVHAGDGEETGGGALGEDAIWSHRSYVNSVPIGADGPTVKGVENPLGGARIGNSKYWIGDYTVEPENGGVGVFAHEFAHDLGLPDEYDTSGNTGGAENSTGFWTIMSSGSYGSQTNDIGSAPTHFNAWDKFQLGFLDHYLVADHDTSGKFSVGPAEFNTAKAQAMFIVLPDKQVTRHVWDPYAGNWMYYGGSGNDLDNTMTRAVTLGSGTINASFRAKYHIEPCWDYAYFQVSDDGGATWDNIDTSRSTDDNTNGQNFGNGITGISGTPLACDDDLSPTPTWVNVTANLNAYANKSVLIRFRYWTDGAAVGNGFSVDNLQITGVATDNAESDPGWEYEGFVRTDGDVTNSYFNAYVIENRQYIGYDYALEVGPYNFGFPSAPNKVEKFRYQDGLLIWYWDEAYADNNVGDHPGHGLILPVDSHPNIMTWGPNSQVRPRINAYDATFTPNNTNPLTLHNPNTGAAKTFPSQPGVAVFDDSVSYWKSGHSSDAPGDGRYQAEWNSVQLPNHGVRLEVYYIDAHVAKFRLNQ